MTEIIAEFNPLNHEHFHSAASILPRQYGGAMIIHTFYHCSQKDGYTQHLSKLAEQLNCKVQLDEAKTNAILDVTTDGWVHHLKVYNDFERFGEFDPTKTKLASVGSYRKAAAYAQPEAYSTNA